MIIGHFRSAWRFRHFILAAITGEMKSRFVRSKIGAAWHILHPLAQATIFALVLSKILGARLGGVDNEAAYAIYLMSGIAAWSLFTEIVNRCLTVFIEYGNTLKKIAFPRIALPIIVLGSALLNHALLLLAVAVVFLGFGHIPSVHWVALPLGLLITIVMGFGMGIALGIFNVYSRDIGQVMAVVLQMWFWLTPIIYTRDLLPEGIARFVSANPMTPIVEYYQQVLLYQQWPDITTLAYPAGLALVLGLFSAVLFQRASPELVDAL
jgi:lipopolysaccharide transport system permease protein